MLSGRAPNIRQQQQPPAAVRGQKERKLRKAMEPAMYSLAGDAGTVDA
jgi:hypothetical protein